MKTKHLSAALLLPCAAAVRALDPPRRRGRNLAYERIAAMGGMNALYFAVESVQIHYPGLFADRHGIFGFANPLYEE